MRIVTRSFAIGLLLVLVATGSTWSADISSPTAPLGSANVLPTPERPVGWRGDWTGRFPGATPPMTWSRRVKGVTTELRYQASKPAGLPGKDSRQLEYFTIKDWLVAGPFAAPDPANLDQDLLGGEATVQPAEGAKAGATTWKFLRADIETQSRHEHNGGICGNLNVDFLFAFGKITGDRTPLLEDGDDFINKVAYAHTYIYAPQADKVRIQIPFTGAAGRCWLNGKAADLDPKNNAKPFDAVLVKGWNSLLLKISAANGVFKDSQGWKSAWFVSAYLEPIAPVAYETQNIAWMTKLTGRSMSQPIVVGDRIFLGANISDLICLSKIDGRILWLRSNTPYDSLSVEERKAIPAVKETIEPLLAQLYKQNEDAVAAINAVVSPQGLSSEREAELDKKLKEKSQTEKKIHDAFATVDRREYPRYYGNEVSSSNAAPCSDGVRVYWTCGGGSKGPGAQAIACFDLQGNRLWTRHEVMGSEEHGNHQSPALVDDKLIYGVSHTLLALDARTGAELWKDKLKGDLGYGNSPVIARIGGEAVVVTKPTVVRASDGGEICDSKLNMMICDVTPVVDQGIIYNSARWRGWDGIPGIIAVKLPPSAADNGAAQVLWDPVGKDVGMPLRGTDYIIASPLLRDGILYGVDMTGGMIAVDVQSQKGLYQRWLDGYNRFNRYVYGVTASPTSAGKYIYIVDDAGYTHLIQPGPQFKEIGKNVVENLHFSGLGGNPCHQESFYTSLYVGGTRMYLRGEDFLYCIEEKPPAAEK